MANPSKRTPWVVEMQPRGLHNWYSMSAYANKDEALLQLELVQKRTEPESGAQFRCRDIREKSDGL